MSKILLLPRDLFLLYRQKDIDKMIEGNNRNYVIDKLTCEIMNFTSGIFSSKTLVSIW